MGGTLIDKARAIARKVMPRVLRTHPFITAFIAAALVGGGLRFVPASTAAVPGSSASGGSTACAVQ